MKRLAESFGAVAGLAALAVIGLGYAAAEKITGRHIMTGLKAGF